MITLVTLDGTSLLRERFAAFSLAFMPAQVLRTAEAACAYRTLIRVSSNPRLLCAVCNGFCDGIDPFIALSRQCIPVGVQAQRLQIIPDHITPTTAGAMCWARG